MVQRSYCYQFDPRGMGLVACSSSSSFSSFLLLTPPVQQEKLWYYIKRCMDWIVGFIRLNSNSFFVRPLLQRVVLKEKKYINQSLSLKMTGQQISQKSVLSFRAWGNNAQSGWIFLSGKDEVEPTGVGACFTHRIMGLELLYRDIT